MKTAIVLNAPYKIKNVAERDVIYTDGGYRNKKYNKDKNVLGVVGDFDTLGFIPKNERVILLDEEKNFTDGERAILFAKESGATSVVIYGGLGGKTEHVLGNIALLKIAKENGIQAELKGENETVILAEGKTERREGVGVTVSIIPYQGDCTVKESDGLYYPLEQLRLTKSDTRGISNKTTKDKFYVDVSEGEALIIIRK